MYDAKINLEKWTPNRVTKSLFIRKEIFFGFILVLFKEELRCLSIGALKLASKKLNFERLQIKPELAEEMFKFNKLGLY